MKPSKTLVNACRVLRRRVRYTDAGLYLPGNEYGTSREDTEAIRKATRLYVETWITPILDAIETGNTRELAEWTAGERGTRMEDET